MGGWPPGSQPEGVIHPETSDSREHLIISTLRDQRGVAPGSQRELGLDLGVQVCPSSREGIRVKYPSS